MKGHGGEARYEQGHLHIVAHMSDSCLVAKLAEFLDVGVKGPGASSQVVQLSELLSLTLPKVGGKRRLQLGVGGTH